MIVGGASLAALIVALAPIYSHDFAATPRLPDWLTFTTTGHSCIFDSAGKLTYAPNQVALQSVDLSQAAWSKTNTSVTGAAGGYQLLARTSAVSSAFANQPGLLPRGARGIASVRVKLGTVGSLVGLRLQWTYPVRADIVADLSTGTIAYAQGLTGATLHASGIVALGGGEYQIYVCASPPSTDTSAGAVVFGSAAIANSAWEGASGGGGLIDVYAKQPRISVVTHETAPRAVDDVDTGASAYYGMSFDYEQDNRLYYGDGTGLKTFKPNNQLLYSNNFSDGVWTKSALVVSSTTVLAPDGTNTATAFVASSTSNGPHYINQNVFVGGSGSAFGGSIYVKAGAVDRIAIGMYNSASVGIRKFFQLTGDGAPGSDDNFNGGVTQGFKIENVGGGWYRVSIVQASVPYRDFIGLRIYACNTDLNLNYAAADTTTPQIYFWRAQQELLTYQTQVRPYNETTTTPYLADTTCALNGLLIEDTRVNQDRNSTMQGAVVGAPGTLPNFWFEALSGLTRSVAGLGQEFGMNYIDIRLQGTGNGNASNIYFEQTTQIASASGQTWGASFFHRVVGGSTTGLSINIALSERNGAGSALANTVVAIFPNSGLQRAIAQRTFNQATTAFSNHYINFATTNGAAIDITIRLYQPQQEGTYSTSPILTYGATVTRASDLFTFNGNALTTLQGKQGAAIVEAISQYNSAAMRLIGSNSAGAQSILYANSAGTNCQAGTYNETATLLTSAASITSGFRAGVTWDSSRRQVMRTDATPNNDNNPMFPASVPTGMYLGSDRGITQFLNGHIRKISLYNKKLPSALLSARMNLSSVA
jgi:hypothetical protein